MSGAVERLEFMLGRIAARKAELKALLGAQVAGAGLGGVAPAQLIPVAESFPPYAQADIESLPPDASGESAAGKAAFAKVALQKVPRFSVAMESPVVGDARTEPESLKPATHSLLTDQTAGVDAVPSDVLDQFDADLPEIDADMPEIEVGPEVDFESLPPVAKEEILAGGAALSEPVVQSPGADPMSAVEPGLVEIDDNEFERTLASRSPSDIVERPISGSHPSIPDELNDDSSETLSFSEKLEEISEEPVNFADKPEHAEQGASFEPERSGSFNVEDSQTLSVDVEAEGDANPVDAGEILADEQETFGQLLRRSLELGAE